MKWVLKHKDGRYVASYNFNSGDVLAWSNKQVPLSDWTNLCHIDQVLNKNPGVKLKRLVPKKHCVINVYGETGYNVLTPLPKPGRYRLVPIK